MNDVNKRQREKGKWMKHNLQKHTFPNKSPQISKQTMDLFMKMAHQLAANAASYKSCVSHHQKMTSKHFLEGDPDCVYSVLNYDKVEDVKSNITQNIKEGIHYVLNIGDRKVNVYMMFPKCFREKIQKSHKSAIANIAAWLKLAFANARQECSQTLDVYLFFSDLLKLLPISPNPLSTSNVNTAFTTSCMPSTRIVIYRYEEWFKVFIHETIHCLGLDFSGMETKKYDDELKRLFKGYDPAGDVRIYESYCEMWGEIVNVLFCAISPTHTTPTNGYTTKKRARVYSHRRSRRRRHTSTRRQGGGQEDADDGGFAAFSPQKTQIMEDNIRHLLRCEQIFSAFQCAKVLHSQRMTYEELVKGGAHLPKYTEETSSFSYYILKCLLMANVDDFVGWCIKHNTPPLAFSQEGENIHQYIRLIHDKHRDIQWLNVIQSGKEYVEQETVQSPADRWIMRTLRMSFSDCIC